MSWVAGLNARLRDPDARIGRLLLTLRALVQVPWVLVHRVRTGSSFTVRSGLSLVPSATMVELPVLARCHDLVVETAAAGVRGAVVECGVWNGGSAAVLAGAMLQLGAEPHVHLFDSFVGLPPPTDRDGPAEAAAHRPGWCTGDPELASRVVIGMGVQPDHVHVHVGWFDDTFPLADVGPIAVLHVDADWYEPVALSLERFYGDLVPGGLLLINDYGRWEGCDRAVAEFLARIGASESDLVLLGRTGAAFRKP